MEAVDAPEEAVAVPVGRGGAPRPVRRLVPPSVRSLSDSHQAHLAAVAHAFGRSLRAWLINRARTDVGVRMIPATRWTWAELMTRLGDPYCAAAYDPAPLGAPGLVSVSLPLAWVLVDRILGGQGEVTDPCARLSEVGIEVMREVHARVADDLASATRALLTFTPVVGRQVGRLELLRTARPDLELVVCGFEVTVGDATGTVEVALPAADLIAALDRLEGDVTPAGPARHLDERLLDAPVAMRVRFDPAVSTPAALLDLAVGDVLPLPHPRTRPLTVFVGDTRLCAATLGRRGDRLAVAVVADPPRTTGAPR